MKATDLMIGDWVKINYRDKVVKVTAIHDGLIDTTAISPLMEDEYEPIPLTAEILEKNKFSIFGESYYVLFNKDMTVKFSLHFPSKDNYWLIIGHRKYSIRSVHELQHALRLCGIDKGVVL